MTTPAAFRDRGRRPDIEAELTDHYHVGWTYLHDVSSSQFDIDRSLANQARFIALDEDTAALYQEGVERGDAFPAVLAYRAGRAANAKLVVIDGNHRLVAHDRAGAALDVYEIDRTTKAQLVVVMTYSFNTRHGRPTSEQERLSQALYLIDNGASQDAAAGTVNVPMRLLKRAVARANAERRADEAGVDRREWEALAQAGRSRLLNIFTDEGFLGAVHLSYVAHLTATEIFDLVTLLNMTKAATKQRAIIKAETARHLDRIQDSGAGVLSTTPHRQVTPKARVAMMLGQILALPDDVMGIARSYADAERGDAAGRLISASERLYKLALALDPTLQ